MTSAELMCLGQVGLRTQLPGRSEGESFTPERRMRMRSGRLILSSMVFLLAGVPVHSNALTVIITAAAPGTTTASKTLGPVVKTPAGTRTPISLNGLAINGFTFSATAGGTTLAQVISDVSGGVERVYMTNTTITAPTSACSSTAPCKLTLTASSNVGDFPAKASGGYPSGVAVSAFLVKADGKSNAVSDTISVTGQAKASTTMDPINTTPGAGTGDTPTSLPSACTGKSTCLFTATLANGGSFNAQISETIQFQCLTPCDPAKTFSVTITFIRPGDKVTFGVGVAQSTTPTVAGNNFVGALLPHFGNFSPQVQITSGSNFQLKVPFTLNTGSNGINPAVEFVNFSLTPKAVTPFSATIPPGSFKKQSTGSFAFSGVINNVALQVIIVPLGGLNYEFRADGKAAGLLKGAQNPVCVTLTIEDDTSGDTCVSGQLQ